MPFGEPEVRPVLLPVGWEWFGAASLLELDHMLGEGLEGQPQQDDRQQEAPFGSDGYSLALYPSFPGHAPCNAWQTAIILPM